MDSVIIRLSECTEQDIEKHFTDLKVETMQTILKRTLSNARFCYPTFDYWLEEKVFPDLSSGKRDIVFLFDVNNPRKLLGVAILKIAGDEKKICSFRINSKYQRKGAGKKLMDKCFEVLGSRKPMITVPRDMSQELSDPNNCYSAFSNFFSKYFEREFELKEKRKDFYRKGYTEYVYNGSLPIALPNITK